MTPRSAKMIQKRLQNGAPDPPKSSPNGPQTIKIEPKWGPDGVGKRKKSEKKTDATKTSLPPIRPAVFQAKK